MCGIYSFAACYWGKVFGWVKEMAYSACSFIFNNKINIFMDNIKLFHTLISYIIFFIIRALMQILATQNCHVSQIYITIYNVIMWQVGVGGKRRCNKLLRILSQYLWSCGVDQIFTAQLIAIRTKSLKNVHTATCLVLVTPPLGFQPDSYTVYHGCPLGAAELNL